MYKNLLDRFDEEKQLVWLDDDWYSIGYNSAIDAAKEIIKNYFEPVKPIERYENDFRCGKCKMEIKRYDAFCSRCGREVKWK